MFGSKGEWFGITNFKGKYAYVQRGSDLYEFSLKTGKLKWLTENYDNYGRNIYKDVYKRQGHDSGYSVLDDRIGGF